ncbi:glutamate receptor ionotropic, delta-2-like [Penaeus chinensis]|uniref:glutamate receptor ionotropic, delta-2-like n=1 Tax=Penaeus chinensis TaxID=139456 RepID=UPI001FB7EB9A|nr:glutamate receptor ionotropic, delta-2-like [Penaeus chinensis]
MDRAEERLQVPVLYVSWNTCPGVRQRSENTVILNDIQFHMRYSCLTWVLRQWATSFLLARPTPFNSRHNLNISLGTKEAFVAEDIMYRCAGMKEVGNMYRARKALRGRLLRIVTIHRPPFVFLEINSQGKIIRQSGFAFEMLNELQSKFGFRYELVSPYDGNWGNKLNNGTWNGMVGMVYRKEVDLGVGPFTVTLERAEVIDFTFPFYVEPSAILTPAGATSKKILAFLSPFSFEVWLGVLVSFVVLGPIMLVLSRSSSNAFLYPYDTYSASRKVSLFGYYWMLCASLFQQGVTYPMSSPARVVFGGWIVGVIALTCAYTGVLISFLTVPRAENVVDGLYSLPRQSEFLWTFKRNSAHHSLFLGKDTTGIYAQIGAPFLGDEDGLVDANEEGIRKVLERTHVFIKERSFLDFVVEENFRRSGECNLRIAREEFFPAGFGWIHQKGDDIGKLFNKEFILMQQTGLFTKWKLQYWPRANKCTNGGSKSVMQVSSLGHFWSWKGISMCYQEQKSDFAYSLALDIQDMAGSFVVLSSGFVFGGFLLLMEYYFKLRRAERAPAPKPRSRTDNPQLTVDEISEKDLKPLSDTETSSASPDRPQPKVMLQTLKTQKVE